MHNKIEKKAIMVLTMASFQLVSSLGICQESKIVKFNSLSCPEKCWVISHPFVASKALRMSESSRKETDAMEGLSVLDSYHNGGKLDAFRHTYWMALLCTEIHWRKARKLGKAHEKGNERDFKKGRVEEGSLPDKASVTMDLWNNEVGINIGMANSSTKASDIKEKVIEAIAAGACKIIRRNSIGEFLDCSGTPIQENEWENIWENNRCLIMSNQ